MVNKPSSDGKGGVSQADKRLKGLTAAQAPQSTPTSLEGNNEPKLTNEIVLKEMYKYAKAEDDFWKTCPGFYPGPQQDKEEKQSATKRKRASRSPLKEQKQRQRQTARKDRG